jgi:hypothetical protein
MMSELSLSYQRAHHRAMEKVRVRLTLSAAGLGRLSAHRVRVRHMFEHTAFCSSASGGVRCGLSVHAPLLRDAALTKNRNVKRRLPSPTRLRRRRAGPCSGAQSA